MKVSTPVSGGVVQSTQGRDKGNFYLIVKVEPNGFVYVADGKKWLWQSPKRKNGKHLAYLPYTDSKSAEALKKNGLLNDCNIAFFLKQFAKDHQAEYGKQADYK
jgi:ribosomal protein L14E/L6E/L27E